MNDLLKYCSNCFEQSHFVLEESKILGSNRFTCEKCHAVSVKCSIPGCDAMAVAGDQTIAGFYCAEHNGGIRNFKTVNMQMRSLTNYKPLMKNRKWNMKKIVMGAGVGAVSATIIALSGGSAAPFVAAKLGSLGLLGAAGTGTAISSLTGAALTSASLAAIGGTVAGGTAVISAVGAAYGAYKGGAISQGYFGDIRQFGIKKIQSGDDSKPNIIVINGFMASLKENRKEWRSFTAHSYPDHNVFEVEWESKNLINCTELITGVVSIPAFIKAYGRAVAKGIKGVLTLIGLADNPFHQAVVKAQITGVILAEFIGRTPSNKKYVLCGHSLGARVAYYTMLSLASAENKEKSMNRISEAHLFGGAVGNDPLPEWKKVKSVVSGPINNYISQKDKVLQTLYRLALFTSSPIGRNPIKSVKGINNIDCTDHVDGHTKYVVNAPGYIPAYSEITTQLTWRRFIVSIKKFVSGQ